MKWFDEFFERQARAVAQKTSRRGALTKISRALVGTAFLLPVLPFARVAQAAHGAAPAAGDVKVDPKDDTQCEYWRYCSLDGFLCTCCGGSTTTCPPGSQASSVTWIGTCHNPMTIVITSSATTTAAVSRPAVAASVISTKANVLAIVCPCTMTSTGAWATKAASTTARCRWCSVSREAPAERAPPCGATVFVLCTERSSSCRSAVLTEHCAN